MCSKREPGYLDLQWQPFDALWHLSFAFLLLAAAVVAWITVNGVNNMTSVRGSALIVEISAQKRRLQCQFSVSSLHSFSFYVRFSTRTFASDRGDLLMYRPDFVHTNTCAESFPLDSVTVFEFARDEEGCTRRNNG